MADDTKLRAASLADVQRICEIDTDASSKFASIVELADLADGSHGPLEPQRVRDWLEDGDVYVLETSSTTVGFTACQTRDDIVYIAELSVCAAHQGRGHGGRLLGAVFEQAAKIALDSGSAIARVSLTTFADVEWNGPFYRKRGFQEVSPDSLGPWHVQKALNDDKDLARPGYRRCTMLREWKATAGA